MSPGDCGRSPAATWNWKLATMHASCSLWHCKREQLMSSCFPSLQMMGHEEQATRQFFLVLLCWQIYGPPEQRYKTHPGSALVTYLAGAERKGGCLPNTLQCLDVLSSADVVHLRYITLHRMCIEMVHVPINTANCTWLDWGEEILHGCPGNGISSSRTPWKLLWILS